MRHLLLLFLTLVIACGPGAAGGGATPEQAAIVLMGQRVNDDDDSLEQYPECMGVAVSPTTVLTAAHCAPVEGGAFLIVDANTWATTSRGVALADLAFDAGDLRTLVPRQPLLNWLTLAPPRDGPASFVAVRGTDIVALPTALIGNQLSGDVQHGDSGAAVVQGGRVTGIVQSCASSNDTDCDLDGGRFTPLTP